MERQAKTASEIRKATAEGSDLPQLPIRFTLSFLNWQ
jgi:hypothetical protein